MHLCVALDTSCSDRELQKDFLSRILLQWGFFLMIFFVAWLAFWGKRFGVLFIFSILSCAFLSFRYLKGKS